MYDGFESDLDSLHILPLGIIPFENRSLSRARLIKNARLRSVIELFQDEDSGSGQMSIDDAARHLRDHAGASSTDITILRKLGRLPSYDVYSLRVLLREQDIPLNDFDALKLSPEKSTELGGYMKEFTFPLIKEIYCLLTTSDAADDEVVLHIGVPRDDKK
ncbi:MAG: hypothetical protein HUJ11_05540, partial [Arenibacter algicola]|nr:hypothetical protein [Arenibacter algicola]